MVPFELNPEALASRERKSPAGLLLLRLTVTVFDGLVPAGLDAVKPPRVVWQLIGVPMAVLVLTWQLAQAALADRASAARIDPKVAIFLIVIGLLP
jgi:hypothetical protein